MRAIGLATLGALLFAVLGFAIIAWRPGFDPVVPPAQASFPREAVARGATLAAGGFCQSCHTGGDANPLAGGRALRTPFGTIYGTNITPDVETGIGAWSLAAFTRAMREGVDAQGRHLYPAFPYDHYRQLTDADIGDLYAYLMTREPVRYQAPEPDLPFPLTIRPLLAAWKLVFLGAPPAMPQGTDPVRARGAYISEALAHCGACHSPRNWAGAEVAARAYDGGYADGWWSPPLNRTSPAKPAWTEASLFSYLRSWDVTHGGAVGPMAPVAAGLAQLPADDVRAVAAYLAAMMPAPDAAPSETLDRPAVSAEMQSARGRGEAVYAGACASCHESGGAVPFTVASLAQHTTVAAPVPDNVARVVLEGVHPPEGRVGAIMPGFAGTLDPGQIADLLAYLRARFSDEPPWTDLPKAVAALAREEAVKAQDKPGGRTRP